MVMGALFHRVWDHTPLTPINTPESPPELLRSVARQLGERAVSWVVDTNAEGFMRSGELLRHGPIGPPKSLVMRGNEQCLLEILLRLDNPDLEPTTNEDQRAIARDTARRGLPFDLMIDSLRFFQRFWLDSLATIAKPLLSVQEQLEFQTHVQSVVVEQTDRVVSDVITEYLEERRRLSVSEMTARRGIISDILGGSKVPTGTMQGSLGLRGEHLVALVAWRPTPLGKYVEDPGGYATTEAAIRRYLTALGADDGVVVPGARDAAWAWASRHQPFDEPPEERLQGIARELGVNLAVGAPGTGVDGFRQSHQEALTARRLAAATGRVMVVYADIDLAVLLTADVELGRRFVERHLKGLIGDGPMMTDLRATLRVYLDAGRGLNRTAARLTVHRNTVMYRIKKIEEILGGPVSDDPTRLGAALLAHEVIIARDIHSALDGGEDS
jgi:hypothetical protein